MRVVEALARWDECDAVIHLGAVGRNYFVDNMLRAAVASDPNVPQEYHDEGLRLFEQAEADF